MHDADDDLREFEDAVSRAEDAGAEEKIIQLSCPICHEQDFEQIRLYGQHQLYWERYKASRLENMLTDFVGVSRVTSYRCLHCDYIMMFARD